MRIRDPLGHLQIIYEKLVASGIVLTEANGDLWWQAVDTHAKQKKCAPCAAYRKAKMKEGHDKADKRSGYLHIVSLGYIYEGRPPRKVNDQIVAGQGVFPLMVGVPILEVNDTGKPIQTRRYQRKHLGLCNLEESRYVGANRRSLLRRLQEEWEDIRASLDAYEKHPEAENLIAACRLENLPTEWLEAGLDLKGTGTDG
jgi:hypothetical protein